MKATSPGPVPPEIAQAAAPDQARTAAARAADDDRERAADDGRDRRTARGVRDRAARGERPGGHRRFGWLAAAPADGRPHNHLLDPVESAYLRTAIEMIMAGKSERTVTRWLIDEQVPTVRGGAWTSTTVRTMVGNPAVCGYRMLDGDLVRDPVTGEPVVGGWETVATPEEWRRVRARFSTGFPAGRATRPGDPARGEHVNRRKEVARTRKYLLSGFLRCGRPGPSGLICAAVLVGNPATRRTPHGAYACTAAGCRGLARRMDKVDATVTETVLQALTEHYAGVRRERGDWPGQGTLDGLRDRKRLLAEAYAAGTVGPADFFGVLAGLDARIEDCERALSDFLAERELRDLLAGFTRERWSDFDLRQKRIAIGSVIETVTVRPLPAGRSTRAPFDPGLLDVVRRRPVGTV